MRLLCLLSLVNLSNNHDSILPKASARAMDIEVFWLLPGFSLMNVLKLESILVSDHNHNA